MKIIRMKALFGIIVFLLGFAVWGAPEKSTLSFNAYHSPDEVTKVLKEMVNANPGIVAIHKLAVTPGKNEMNLLEIGPEVGKKEKKLPAVFIAANLEGIVPVSTEAALYLSQLIIAQPEVRKDKTWYILPVGNPDAGWHYFKNPLEVNSRNSRPYNDDMDDRKDEDGPDDLNGDGIISTMRVKSPKGEWVPISGEPRLMKRADWSKGETGLYKLYTEGMDNDNDGEFNEDGHGGVNLKINFPHLFQFHTKTGGSYAGSEEETYNLIKFIYAHPEIAMTLCFGDTNFCMTPPQSGRKESSDLTKIKLPDWIGKMFGIDTTRTYTMEEVMEQAKKLAPAGMEISESMVIGMLGLGIAVNPQQEDMKFYNAISEQYKEFLKANKLDGKRLDPANDRDGSFELWSYYHLGLPSFTLDFWSLPVVEEAKKEAEITPEKLSNMTNEEFIALGEEKIDAFLKAAGAPGDVKAKMLIGMVKGGALNTKKMAEMLKQMPKPKSAEGMDAKEKALLAFNDKELKGKGFIEWKAFKHPQLGEVEIGGAVPFTDNTPPASMLENLLKGQVPWVFELTKKIARIKIAKTEVKPMGAGVYQVKAWIENTGFLPYSTAMGNRNERITPIAVTIEGKNIRILEGKKRNLVDSIPGHSLREVKWLILSSQASPLQLTAQSMNAWSDTQSVSLNDGGAK